MNKLEIINTVIDVCKRSDVRKASFFGSIVSGKFNSNSDIDILIEFNNKETKSLLDLIELKQILEEKTHNKIDLLTFDSINPSLHKSILENNELIYG
jgi:uncharacterized protein